MVKINIEEINRRMENTVKIKELRERESQRSYLNDFLAFASTQMDKLNFGKKMNTKLDLTTSELSFS